MRITSIFLGHTVPVLLLHSVNLTHAASDKKKIKFTVPLNWTIYDTFYQIYLESPGNFIYFLLSNVVISYETEFWSAVSIDWLGSYWHKSVYCLVGAVSGTPLNVSVEIKAFSYWREELLLLLEKQWLLRVG